MNRCPTSSWGSDLFAQLGVGDFFLSTEEPAGWLGPNRFISFDLICDHEIEGHLNKMYANSAE